MAQTLSILIPVFNEARTVRKLLERVASVHFIGGVKTQLVVVNDCSKDDTLAVYREQTKPVEQHYRARGLLAEIDGQRTPDEVFGRMLASARGEGV